MKTFAWIFSFGILLTGCVTTSQSTEQPLQSPYQGIYNQRVKEAEIMATEIEAELKSQSPEIVLDKVYKNISHNLKDPDSAKFRNVRFVRFNNRIVVCGEINAKNSYGGYAGYEGFISGMTLSNITSSANYETAAGSADSAGFRAYCLLGEKFNP